MNVFGLAGHSGSGKTTLMVRLLPELVRRGLKVSTVKHAHHNFDVDLPGKDSYEHRAAGAFEVMVSSKNRWVLMHENRGDAESDLASLLARMSAVDLVLVEGFKREGHDKIEVVRGPSTQPLLYKEDQRIVAFACDRSLAGMTLPVLDLDDAVAISDFIVAHCGLAAPSRAADGGS